VVAGTLAGSFVETAVAGFLSSGVGKGAGSSGMKRLATSRGRMFGCCIPLRAGFVVDGCGPAFAAGLGIIRFAFGIIQGGHGVICC
jgi:hypothetical protein